MSVINTNVSATIARNAIGTNERAMATSMERLSTGLRINSAKGRRGGSGYLHSNDFPGVHPEYGCAQRKRRDLHDPNCRGRLKRNL